MASNLFCRIFVIFLNSVSKLDLQIAKKLQLFRSQEKQRISFCTFPASCSANPMNVFLKAATPTIKHYTQHK